MTTSHSSQKTTAPELSTQITGAAHTAASAASDTTSLATSVDSEKNQAPDSFLAAQDASPQQAGAPPPAPQQAHSEPAETENSSQSSLSTKSPNSPPAPRYTFKVNGNAEEYSHEALQKMVAAGRGFAALQAEREQATAQLSEERNAIKEEVLRRLLSNMPEFLQYKTQHDSARPHAEPLNPDTARPLRHAAGSHREGDEVFTEEALLPQSTARGTSDDARAASSSDPYLENLETLREDYHDLLSELNEQAELLQAEESTNFFAHFFEQHQETNPITKNVFFELLDRLQNDGHAHGDYNAILDAARTYSHSLIGETLHHTPPQQLATLLGEESLSNLSSFLTTRQQAPLPVGSIGARGVESGSHGENPGNIIL